MLTSAQKDLGLKLSTCASIISFAYLLGTNSTHTSLVGNGCLHLLINQDANSLAGVAIVAKKVVLISLTMNASVD